MPFEIGAGDVHLLLRLRDHRARTACGVACDGEEEFLRYGDRDGRSMMRDFAVRDGDYHPILALPSKEPLERDPLRWSRTSGLLSTEGGDGMVGPVELTGEREFRAPYERVLEESLATFREFLPGHPDVTR